MAVELPELIDEFERLSLDDKIFFRIESEEDIEVDILFERDGNKRNWSVWFPLSEANSKQTVSKIFLPQVLKAFRIPESVFFQEISSVLLTQAAFANEFIREISEILGYEQVDSSVRQTQEFMNALRLSVGKAVGEKPPVPLADGAIPQKATLRVVKSPVQKC